MINDDRFTERASSCRHLSLCIDHLSFIIDLPLRVPLELLDDDEPRARRRPPRDEGAPAAGEGELPVAVPEGDALREDGARLRIETDELGIGIGAGVELPVLARVELPQVILGGRRFADNLQAFELYVRGREACAGGKRALMELSSFLPMHRARDWKVSPFA